MQSVKTLFAVTILMLCFASQATSGPLEDGRAASERGDHVTAFRVLQSSSRSG